MEDLKLIGQFIIAFLLWYGVISLVEWDYNLAHWGWLARLFWLVASLYSFIRTVQI